MLDSNTFSNTEMSRHNGINSINIRIHSSIITIRFGGSICGPSTMGLYLTAPNESHRYTFVFSAQTCNHFMTKRNPLYLKTQFVPRSKHSVSVIKPNS